MFRRGRLYFDDTVKKRQEKEDDGSEDTGSTRMKKLTQGLIYKALNQRLKWTMRSLL